MNQYKSSIFLHLHLAILFGIILSLAITGTNAFKLLIKLNIIFVFAIIVYELLIYGKTSKIHDVIINILKLSIFPIGFTALHWIASNKVSLHHNANHIWQSYFLMASFYLLTGHPLTKIKKYAFPLILSLLFTYTLLQIIALNIHYNAYGTTANPHYLALYSALLLATNIFLIPRKNGFIKLALILNIFPLGYFILVSSSRPVWLALLISTVVVLLIFDRSKFRNIIFAIFAIQAFLLAANIEHYRDRLFELTMNIQHEERVSIWLETIRLLKLNNLKDWLIGHGIDSFRPHFLTFSHYNSPTGFRSPHNIILDVLFTFGITGIILVTCLYYLLYKECVLNINANIQIRSFMYLLLVLISTNFMFNAINMTFFSEFNIFPIAIFVGLTLFISKAFKS